MLGFVDLLFYPASVLPSADADRIPSLRIHRAMVLSVKAMGMIASCGLVAEHTPHMQKVTGSVPGNSTHGWENGPI